MYCASSMKASQYTSRWGIVNKHTALHALKEACKGAHSFAACLQMMAIFLGLGADEILSISSSVLWLLVILLVLLPGPQRLTDLHVRTNILGIQFISIHQQYHCRVAHQRSFVGTWGRKKHVRNFFWGKRD